MISNLIFQIKINIVLKIREKLHLENVAIYYQSQFNFFN